MSTSLQLIVFDLSGTTVEDHQGVQRCLQDALRDAADVTISLEAANRVMGIPKPVAIRQLLEEQQHPADAALIETIHARFQERMIAYYRSDPRVHEKAGVSETFRTLQEHDIRVVVNTGFDRSITDVLLEHMGWQHQGLIDGSVTSDEVAAGRPAPDMIFRAMELTGVTSAAHVGKVGDTASDLQEGTAAGCGLVVGVTTGAYTAEALAPEPHTHLIAQLPELLSILALAPVPTRK
ncbi:phosphonatase-like hydrolase [Catalinimonas alkaloidigena]|uniref:Phosphonatase-like hydrolase n=1 Tax=Catalinimonas alkaloidigena TaxID=1075417 RepID=A0A1G9NH24_9BACT|nr:HAD hydrolase-like protein [Catalinimonas alkaloidigena]SDL85653.1 phosphonatase-like hydrolase [Catalinimonas alkaloidigena]